MLRVKKLNNLVGKAQGSNMGGNPNGPPQPI
jgi:hypothetical protein